MIYTVTLNPSIDYVVSLDGFKKGETNRALSEHIMPGGKGINVSLVLTRLGLENIALGFVAGFTGREIASRVGNSDFIFLKNGITRINIKLKDYEETEINGVGASPSASELEALFSKIALVGERDYLVLSGSVPKSLDEEIYARIIQSVSCRVIVDTHGKALESTLSHRPFLIKPNRSELCELLGVSSIAEHELEASAHALQARGARNVMVSLGGDGALLLDENQALHRLPAVSGTIKSTVGAGDSMVAGFVAGCIRYGDDYKRAFRLSLACAAATAFSDTLASAEEIEKIAQMDESLRSCEM